MLAGLLCLAGAGYAHETAPATIRAQLLACGDISVSADRLACFDGVTASLAERPAEPASQARAERPAAAAVEGGQSDDRAADDSGPGAALSETAMVQANDSGTAPASPPAVDDFGRDSMKAEPRKQDRPEEDVSITAVIIDVRTHHDRRFSVELDNGQVWRETQGSRVRTPRVGRSVEIRKGNLGGYRMKIEDSPRLAWVRRVK